MVICQTLSLVVHLNSGDGEEDGVSASKRKRHIGRPIPDSIRRERIDIYPGDYNEEEERAGVCYLLTRLIGLSNN